MSTNAEILIFGRIENAESLGALASAMASEALIEWSRAMNGPEDAVAYLEERAGEGVPVVVNMNDIRSLFPGIQAACQAAGLSYIVRYGPSSDEAYDTQDAYAPDRGLAQGQQIGSHGEPVVPLREIQEAQDAGMVPELLMAARRKALMDVGYDEMKIALAPGIADEWRASQPPKP